MIKLYDRKMRKLALEESNVVPDEITEYVDSILINLPEKDSKPLRWKRYHSFNFGGIVVAACITMFLLVNISPKLSYAMETIPILGDFVHVITIRNYIYDKGNNSLDIKIPKIVDEDDQITKEKINKNVERWTEQIKQQFYNDIKAYGEDAHLYTDVDYKTITNTPQWFTLKLQVTQISASSNIQNQYYHINKVTDELVAFSDLFQKGSQYNESITKDIKRQMKEQMINNNTKYYWIDEEEPTINFQTIAGDQNFYISSEGKLTIVFDQYEVAPGYMGCPEFEIEKTVYQDYLKKEYTEVFR